MKSKEDGKKSAQRFLVCHLKRSSIFLRPKANGARDISVTVACLRYFLDASFPQFLWEERIECGENFFLQKELLQLLFLFLCSSDSFFGTIICTIVGPVLSHIKKSRSANLCAYHCKRGHNLEENLLAVHFHLCQKSILVASEIRDLLFSFLLSL